LSKITARFPLRRPCHGPWFISQKVKAAAPKIRIPDTRLRLPLACLLASAIVALLPACQTKSFLSDGRRIWPAKASPSIMGDRLLVVFMPDDWPPRLSQDDQELYAEWARLLESFVKNNSSLREVRKIDFRRADEFFYGQGLPVNEYSLLFVRGDGMALYASQPIFDGNVYDYAEAFLGRMEADFFWAGILHAGETEAGMPRALKLVQLREADLMPPPAPDGLVPAQPPVAPPPAPGPQPPPATAGESKDHNIPA
jgi:hypothetical protein